MSGPLVGIGVALISASSAMACAAETGTPISERGSVHAFLTVERTDSDGTLRAEALAGFAQVPPSVDADRVLSLVGLELKLPPPGRCGTQGEEGSDLAYPDERVELLEAGEVVVEAGPQRTQLAPNAFPTVTDLISGVLYTTRDRSAEPLPAATSYSVQASGGLGVAPFAVASDAPGALEDLKLNDEPLTSGAELSVREPILLEWRPGSARDVVYAELSSAASGRRVVCSFRDDDGTGTIPGGLWSRGDDSQIAIHRLRTRSFEGSGIDVGELRFDFAAVSSVRFND